MVAWPLCTVVPYWPIHIDKLVRIPFLIDWMGVPWVGIALWICEGNHRQQNLRCYRKYRRLLDRESNPNRSYACFNNIVTDFFAWWSTPTSSNPNRWWNRIEPGFGGSRLTSAAIGTLCCFEYETTWLYNAEPTPPFLCSSETAMRSTYTNEA